MNALVGHIRTLGRCFSALLAAGVIAYFGRWISLVEKSDDTLVANRVNNNMSQAKKKSLSVYIQK